MNQEKIGKFIAEARKKNDLTQKQLAEILGTTSKSVSRWENGKTMPDYSLLEPLSKELNISILELLKGEYINKNTKTKNEDINALLELVMEMSEKYHFKRKLIFSFMLIAILLIVSIIYYIYRFYGYDNSYLWSLLQHISIIPFNSIYSFICLGEIESFIRNILINILLSIPISCLILTFVKNKKKYFKFLLILNILLEIFKWLLLIGIFDIDDIIIRSMGGIMIFYIYQKFLKINNITDN